MLGAEKINDFLKEAPVPAQTGSVKAVVVCAGYWPDHSQ